MSKKFALPLLLTWLTCILPALTAAEPAAAPPTGTIEGRVLNADNGQYLNGVRVTVETTNLEVFTDGTGFYRLSQVPAGTATVHVFFTGATPLTRTIPVPAGDTARGDFEISPSGGSTRDRSDETVQLASFVVAETKDRNAAAVAINEQRFAPNIKNVVSTDEFGGDAEGNVGEFLKFLPGMSLDYAGGNARSVSLNGAPAAYVPMTINGFSLASPGGDSGTNRSVALDFVSINNLSRIEVEFAPTPETQGGALAGSVNMVPRAAFERARPVFESSLYLTMRDDARDFHKTPGPGPSLARKVHPGADFSYIVPVNKWFGFTLNASNMVQYAEEDQLLNTWRGVNTATNGAAFPHTTTDKPYLTSLQVSDSGKDTTRRSLGTSLDFKFGKYDQVTLGYQAAATKIDFYSRFLVFNVTKVNPGDFSPNFTHGAVNNGNLTTNSQGRLRNVLTWMPSVTWRHSGPLWKTETGLATSKSSNLFRDLQDGRFYSPAAQRTGLTIWFDDFAEDAIVPGKITVTDGATGLPVNPYRLDTFALNTANTNEARTTDTKNTAYFNIRRDFYGRIPVTLKAGLDVRQAIRDTRGTNYAMTYYGPDGRPSSTPAGGDDAAAPFVDTVNARNWVNYGFPAIEAINPWALYQHYLAHPEYFVNTTGGVGPYTNQMNASKRAEETVTAAFIRGDVSLFSGRLKFVGGLRAEQTNIDARGPLNDPTLNYKRDTSGRVLVDAAGKPQLIAPAGSLDATKLTIIERGAHTKKEYLRLFPRLNASFNATENLIFRAAHYYSIGRPDYNQYAGGVTLPDSEAVPGPNNRFTMTNTGIKPWSSHSTMARVEYYFQGVGLISAGVFRRDFQHFFGNTVMVATPEFLDLYGLDYAQYGAYEVSTQYNLPGLVRNQGWDVNYKQALTFLPHWARGVQVFANTTVQTVHGGTEATNLGGFVPRVANYGVSLTRPKFSVRLNWNYRGRTINNRVPAGASIDPEAFNITPARRTCDFIGQYNFYRHLSLFANLRNIFDVPIRTLIAAPTTPRQAQFRNELRYGSLWTFGIKGTF